MIRKIIAYLMMLLLGIRPLVNLFKSRETFVALFSIGSYSVTMLSVWSMCMIFVMALYLTLRLLKGGIPGWSRSQVLIIVLIWYILLTGATRAHESVINTVGYMCLYFVAVIMAPIFYEDVTFEKLAKWVMCCSLVLIILHSTACLWYGGPTSSRGLMNYTGAFNSKHIASVALYINLPALIYLSMVKKSRFALFLTAATVVLILLVFQRNTMLSLIVLMFVFSFQRRSSKPVLAIIFLVGLIVLAVPKKVVDYNLRAKSIAEIEKAERGNVGALGAGRMGVIIGGIKYWYHMGIGYKLFGLGAGGGNRITSWGSLSLHTHNQWIQTLLDYGLIGVILLIVVLVSLFRDARKAAIFDKEGMGPIAFAFLCAVIVRTCTSNYFHGGASDLFIAFTIGYPIYYLAQKESEIEPVPSTSNRFNDAPGVA